VKNLKKLVICVGLATILSAPLAGCGGTWNGMKEDWHGMTGSNESESSTTTASAQPAAAPAQTAPAQDTTMHSETTTTTTFNR
jgi:hypothetical protein